MGSRGRLAAAGLAVIIVASIVALAVSRVHSSDSNESLSQRPPGSPPSAADYYQFADVDSSGSVVLDSGKKPKVFGVNGSGVVVWTRSLATGTEPVVPACMSSCPDAAVSGNLLASPTTADAAVVWIEGGRVTTEASDYDGAPGKKRVIAALSSDVAILQESDLRGRARLELRDRPHRPLNVPLPIQAATTLIAGLANAAFTKVLLAVPTGATTSDLDTYMRGPLGWRREASVAAPPGQHLGCLNSTGSEAITLGPTATFVVTSEGGLRPLRGIQGSNCVFDSAGVVVVNYQTKEVTQYDHGFQSIWTVPFSQTVVPATRSDSSYVALGGRFSSEVIAPDGTVSVHLPHGAWARIASRERVAYLDGAGGVHLARVRG